MLAWAVVVVPPFTFPICRTGTVGFAACFMLDATQSGRCIHATMIVLLPEQPEDCMPLVAQVALSGARFRARTMLVSGTSTGSASPPNGALGHCISIMAHGVHEALLINSQCAQGCLS